MSLEQALEENTKAVQALTAALLAGKPTALLAGKPTATDTPAVTPAVTPGKSKSVAPTAQPADTAPTAGESDAPETKDEPSDTRPVSQADVVDAFRAYIRKHGVEAAKANILEPYKLPKITAAADEQLPELLALLTKE